MMRQAIHRFHFAGAWRNAGRPHQRWLLGLFLRGQTVDRCEQLLLGTCEYFVAVGRFLSFEKLLQNSVEVLPGDVFDLIDRVLVELILERKLEVLHQPISVLFELLFDTQFCRRVC
jgi:hypothetical protein